MYCTPSKDEERHLEKFDIRPTLYMYINAVYSHGREGWYMELSEGSLTTFMDIVIPDHADLRARLVELITR